MTFSLSVNKERKGENNSGQEALAPDALLSFRSPFSPFSLRRHHQCCLCLPALTANVYGSNDEVVEWVVFFFLFFSACSVFILKLNI